MVLEVADLSRHHSAQPAGTGDILPDLQANQEVVFKKRSLTACGILPRGWCCGRVKAAVQTLLCLRHSAEHYRAGRPSTLGVANLTPPHPRTVPGVEMVLVKALSLC